MNKVEALEILSTKAWSMWKPGKRIGVDEKIVKHEDVFAGVQIVCTQDEWLEIIVALHDGGE